MTDRHTYTQSIAQAHAGARVWLSSEVLGSISNTTITII